MWTRRILSRALGTVQRGSVDRQLEREVEAHLALLEQQFIRQGMSGEEAKLAARREFGGVEQIKEEYRQRGRFSSLEQLVRDLYFGFRSLRRSPGFSLIAMTSLALGIGVNTAIFTLLNALVLETLPVPAPERLVEVQVFNKPLQDYQNFFSYPFYRELAKQNAIFDGITAEWGKTFELRQADHEAMVPGMYVSGTYFGFLHAVPYFGRLLDPDDDGTEGAHSVCVLSYKAWKNTFGADRRVIGKAIWLNDKAMQVVGVTEPEFTGLSLQNSPDVIVPMSMLSAFGEMHRDDAHMLWLNVLAHLRPAITQEQASERLNAVAKRIVESLPQDGPYDRGAAYRVKPAPRGFDDFGSLSRPLIVLMCTVGLVLLIATLNLANLLLTRGQQRQREIAMRLSLGAGRWRIVRQLLVESAYLAIGGAALGFGMGTMLVSFLVSEFNKGKSYGQLEVSPDVHVLLFTSLLAGIAVLLFGAMPTWLASNVSPHDALKGGSQGTLAQPRRSRLRRSLLFAQVTLTMILLFGAALFERSLRNLRTINIAADPDHIVMADITLSSISGKRYAPGSLLDDLNRRVERMPEVVSVAYGVPGLLSGAMFSSSVSVHGKSPDSSALQTLFSDVSPNYLRTVGIPLIEGRDFSTADRKGSAPVAIVNEKFAATYFPHENPLGKQFKGGTFDAGELNTIVGIVKNVPYLNLRDDVKSMVYRPMLQTESPWQVLTVRVRGNPELFERQVTALIHKMAPEMPLQQFKTVALQRDATIARERLLALLSTLFGVLALTLSSVGLYGLVSYSVTKRRQEIGIRVSLGAGSRNVLKLFLTENLSIVIAGAIIGCLLGIAGTHFVRTLLYGLPQTDFASVYLAAGTLLLVALTASLVPAVRATRIDPAQALRAE